jgi:mannose-6-phosphate isomerase-like protein (cupin superfamily)
VTVVTEGEIECAAVVDGEWVARHCPTGSVTVVPPGTPHRIRNVHPTRPASFVLTQSPYAGFDFVREGPGE